MGNDNKKMISTYELMPIITEMLDNGQKVKFTVTGTSMLPWIAPNRDQVLLSCAKKNRPRLGDIILFQDDSSKYILHRIYKREVNGYRTIGDGCLQDDGLVEPEDIIGVVEKIYRKEEEIDCYSFPWRYVLFLWRKLLPIRRHLLGIYFWLVKVKATPRAYKRYRR
ncbi:MAG: hypothetical protein K0R21_17 [Anaerocolumna sp.]|jgi:hypothetical protein|nr:hypothetical protein [Anaerocolumna sp.]